MNSEHGTGQSRERVQRFFDAIPYSDVLGIELAEVRDSVVITRLPYSEALVGNPDTGVLHGGAITAVVDQSSGGAVLAALGGFEPIATLDLRIDYLKPARPRETVLVRAHCYRLAAHIAFVRCVVYQDSIEEAVATSMSTFMRTASGQRPSLTAVG